MPRRLIYTVFSLGSSAMLLFIGGYLCKKSGLALFSGYLYTIASNLLLASFALLLLFGLVATLLACYRDLCGYWRCEASALRRVLSTHYKTQHTAQRNQQQARQLYYLKHFKHQQLTAADNRKQIYALYRSVQHELNHAKNQFSATEYRYLCKTLRQYRKQANAAAILTLHQQLLCR